MGIDTKTTIRMGDKTITTVGSVAIEHDVKLSWGDHLRSRLIVTITDDGLIFDTFANGEPINRVTKTFDELYYLR